MPDDRFFGTPKPASPTRLLDSQDPMIKDEIRRAKFNLGKCRREDAASYLEKVKETNSETSLRTRVYCAVYNEMLKNYYKKPTSKSVSASTGTGALTPKEQAEYRFAVTSAKEKTDYKSSIGYVEYSPVEKFAMYKLMQDGKWDSKKRRFEDPDAAARTVLFQENLQKTSEADYRRAAAFRKVATDKGIDVDAFEHRCKVEKQAQLSRPERIVTSSPSTTYPAGSPVRRKEDAKFKLAGLTPVGRDNYIRKMKANPKTRPEILEAYEVANAELFDVPRQPRVDRNREYYGRFVHPDGTKDTFFTKNDSIAKKYGISQEYLRKMTIEAENSGKDIVIGDNGSLKLVSRKGKRSKQNDAVEGAHYESPRSKDWKLSIPQTPYDSNRTFREVNQSLSVAAEEKEQNDDYYKHANYDPNKEVDRRLRSMHEKEETLNATYDSELKTYVANEDYDYGEPLPKNVLSREDAWLISGKRKYKPEGD